MPQVYNWHLGRDMLYRYSDSRPKRQFAAVFNINRCIACQACTMACKSTWTFSRGQEFMWWNNVETKPYGGYPQFWDARTLELLGQQGWDPGALSERSPYGRYTGKTLFEAAGSDEDVVGYVPEDKEWRAPNIYEDTTQSAPKLRDSKTYDWAELPEHKMWFFYLQRICNHCTYPACLASCPRGAIYKRPEDGIVLIDQKRCRGYRKCVRACPYKKPMYNGTTHVSEKCIACYPRVEGKDPLTEGKPMETRCMTACVGKIRLQGFLDKNPDNPIHYLVHQERVALPLYPQLGTEPNVYYIPPRWVPRPYLVQTFGPGIYPAIQRYVNPSVKLLGCLQLFRTTQRIIFSFEVLYQGSPASDLLDQPYNKLDQKTKEGIEVVGYDEARQQVVRLPVEHPLIVRKDDRFNTT